MRYLFALPILFLGATPLVAQQTPSPWNTNEELVDRVVAVVGDTAILLSDVQAQLQQLRESGRSLPDDPQQQQALVRSVLESRVEDLVLLEAARMAGVEVREEQILSLVEEDLDRVRKRFPSEADFVRALETSGLSVDRYRQTLIQQQRDRSMVQNFLQQRLAGSAGASAPVTDAELREIFQAQKASMGPRPATVSLQQAIIRPRPSESSRAEARRTAEDVLKQLREGADFAVLARRFSDDPGSKEHGGDLGWFRRGRMVPEFESAVYSLHPGQLSGVVETDFGYHIIRLEKVRAGERQARHILIQPEVTEEDVARAETLADSIAVLVRAGKPLLPFAREHETPAPEVELTNVPEDRLPPAYTAALDGVAAGEVVGPISLEDPRGTSWAVVKLTERVGAGEYRFEDVKEQIRARAQEQKAIEQLVEELSKKTYINIML